MLYLGSIIRECRMKKGLTQEQLGQELGVSTQSISRWENSATYRTLKVRQRNKY